MPSKSTYFAKAVGYYLPKVTQRVFARQGFPSAALLTDWPSIVGPELARWTAPERVVWPRQSARGREGKSQGGDEKPPASHASALRGPHGERAATGRRPRSQATATLWLRVASHMALEVQYETETILSRINSYFGYPAIGRLRFVQAPVVSGEVAEDQKTRPSDLPPSAMPEGVDLSGIADEGLRNALARLAIGRRKA